MVTGYLARCRAPFTEGKACRGYFKLIGEMLVLCFFRVFLFS